MQKFCSVVTFVEAIRWLGNSDFPADIPASVVAIRKQDGRAVVATPEGNREMSVGDWIVKDESGAYMPMRDDIFKQKYRPA